MDLSRFATTCFFCKNLCLHPDYEFHRDVDESEWIKKYGDKRKIIGSIGNLKTCDVCLDDLYLLLVQKGEFR